jgi:hypothetical protein
MRRDSEVPLEQRYLPVEEEARAVEARYQHQRIRHVSDQYGSLPA